MSQCIYCGKDAGLLKKFHKECNSKFLNGKAKVLETAVRAATTKTDINSVEQIISKIAEASFIDTGSLKPLYVTAFENAVEVTLADNALSEAEADALNAYIEHFNLAQSDLDNHFAYTKFVQGVVIQEILEGKIPERAKIQGNLPFNFLKSEIVVWLFNDVKYLETRSRTVYSGGSSGMSVRVARGLYFRTGSFRGSPTTETSTVEIGNGMLAVTDKNIYFAGGGKSFRIPYSKIVSFTPFSDGIGIQKDSASAKPQAFVTGDGWFIYNLIFNLAKM